ncbi:gluconokinase [Nocardioides rotundus]|uniref:gluconokinase n=1 Tax=Nocardioides rotundus TaxID=1774216 RepID=UPI001CBE4887|nr:gluconokinase [Nocardioides rotundus]UAL31069.1 gluconokinase [Nocardioides rotundus]
MTRDEPNPSLVVMGVSGTGKTTVGRALAAWAEAPYVEGDDHHPQSNIDKMAAGIPLTDEDRWPWLTELGGLVAAAAPDPMVLTCSALKRAYRDLLRETAGEQRLFFVHLAGTREVLMSRMTHRRGHFMPPSLLDSQLATLEPLQPDEWGVTVDVAPPLAQVVAVAEQAVRLALEGTS